MLSNQPTNKLFPCSSCPSSSSSSSSSSLSSSSLPSSSSFLLLLPLLLLLHRIPLLLHGCTATTQGGGWGGGTLSVWLFGVCCWDVKQPTNKQTTIQYSSSFSLVRVTALDILLIHLSTTWICLTHNLLLDSEGFQPWCYISIIYKSLWKYTFWSETLKLLSMNPIFVRIRQKYGRFLFQNQIFIMPWFVEGARRTSSRF